MSDRLLVLAVDDDADARETLAMLLRLDGHDVAVAADGPSAVRAALRERPDVVLLDIGLPGMDGYAVGRTVKEARPEKPPFVVAVTGVAEDEGRRQEAGIDLHLRKPLDPERLRRLIGRFGRVVEEGEATPMPPLTVRPRGGAG